MGAIDTINRLVAVCGIDPDAELDIVYGLLELYITPTQVEKFVQSALQSAAISASANTAEIFFTQNLRAQYIKRLTYIPDNGSIQADDDTNYTATIMLNSSKYEIITTLLNRATSTFPDKTTKDEILFGWYTRFIDGALMLFAVMDSTKGPYLDVWLQHANALQESSYPVQYCIPDTVTINADNKQYTVITMCG